MFQGRSDIRRGSTPCGLADMPWHWPQSVRLCGELRPILPRPGAGNYTDDELQGAMNLPVSDTFAARWDEGFHTRLTRASCS